MSRAKFIVEAASVIALAIPLANNPEQALAEKQPCPSPQAECTDRNTAPENEDDLRVIGFVVGGLAVGGGLIVAGMAVGGEPYSWQDDDEDE